MTLKTMEDEAAYARGFTREIYAEGGCEGASFLVRPDVDLDSRFEAWSLDWQEWTRVNGASCLIEEAA